MISVAARRQVGLGPILRRKGLWCHDNLDIPRVFQYSPRVESPAYGRVCSPIFRTASSPALTRHSGDPRVRGGGIQSPSPLDSRVRGSDV